MMKKHLLSSLLCFATLLVLLCPANAAGAELELELKGDCVSDLEDGELSVRLIYQGLVPEACYLVRDELNGEELDTFTASATGNGRITLYVSPRESWQSGENKISLNWGIYDESGWKVQVLSLNGYIQAGKNDTGFEAEAVAQPGETVTREISGKTFIFRTTGNWLTICLTIDEDASFAKSESDEITLSVGEAAYITVVAQNQEETTYTIQVEPLSPTEETEKIPAPEEEPIPAEAETSAEEIQASILPAQQEIPAPAEGLSLSAQGLFHPLSTGSPQHYLGYTKEADFRLTALATHEESSILIQGSSTACSGTGMVSGDFPLLEGINLFTVSLWEADGENSFCTLSIYRVPAQPLICTSSQRIMVDGTEKILRAYNINGNNFLQLRDIAMLLNDTEKSFSLSYDPINTAVAMETGKPYFPNGTENQAQGPSRKAAVSDQCFTLNGKAIYPMAYNIDGSNYVLLRDAAALLNLELSYAAGENTIHLRTATAFI